MVFYACASIYKLTEAIIFVKYITCHMDTRASTLRLFVFIGTCIISFVGFERKVSLMFIIIGHIRTCLQSIFSFIYNYIQLFRISENCFSLCLSV